MLMNYKAISKGLNDRELVKESEVTARLTQLLDKNPNLDYYVSVFKYNEKHLNQFKINKSLSGINDNVASSIIFDFDDSSGTLKVAQSDAAILVDRLVADGVDTKDVKIYFSGAKGMHIEVNTDKDFTREELINIRTKYTEGLNTSDNVIKDNQRIIRAVFSKHNKSGLYKIPLTYEELKTATPEEIKFWAKDPDNERYILENSRSGVITPSENMLSAAKPIKQKEPSTVEAIDKPDFSKNKTGLTNAKYALSQGFFGAGERHEAVMILAATYMGLGWPLELAYNSIKATLRMRADRDGTSRLNQEGKNELYKEVKSVFSINWKGGMYSDDKNPLLLKTKKTYNIEEKYDNNITVNISEVDNIFLDFATNIDKNTIKLGIKSFDDNIRITTSTLNMLLAPPGVGKSNISFGILNHTSLAGIKSMFFSLDMATPQVYQRLVQRHNNFRPDEIFNIYKNNQKLKIEQIKISVDENYKNVKFCFKGAMSIDKIRETLLTEKNKTGVFPKLVIIDYLENITTDFSDSSQSKAFAARSLKDIANEFEICVILLVQPRLSGGDGATELNSYTDIKGSSVLGETATTVITAYRPGFNPKDNSNDNFLSLTVVKNRMGQLGRFDYHWDGLTGQIRELLTEEKQELSTLLKSKAEENKNEL